MKTIDDYGEYYDAIKNARSRRTKELILARAVQDKALALFELIDLAQLAFPEDE